MQTAWDKQRPVRSLSTCTCVGVRGYPETVVALADPQTKQLQSSVTTHDHQCPAPALWTTRAGQADTWYLRGSGTRAPSPDRRTGPRTSSYPGDAQAMPRSALDMPTSLLSRPMTVGGASRRRKVKSCPCQAKSSRGQRSRRAVPVRVVQQGLGWQARQITPKLPDALKPCASARASGRDTTLLGRQRGRKRRMRTSTSTMSKSFAPRSVHASRPVLQQVTARRKLGYFSHCCHPAVLPALKPARCTG